VIRHRDCAVTMYNGAADVFGGDEFSVAELSLRVKINH
jgi:hypothetical protein